MKEFLFWWIGIEAVGLAAFPLTYVFLRRLPDRGFAFTKVVGLLLLGYGFWAGAVVGLFPNTRGAVILVLLLMAGVSALVAGRHRDEIGEFLRFGWRYIAFVEVLFFVVLGAAVFIRSFAPEIIWGEKPFELAFLNSIDRSEFFPPDDPWLSGSSISYYYFGYVMIVALSKLVALSTTTTFYLGLSLVAALASVAVFGLVYNMIAVSRRAETATAGGVAAEVHEPGGGLIPRAAIFGLAGAALMAVVSNLAGVFELLARHGVGSTGFYDAVGIAGLNSEYDCAAAPGDCTEWYPTRFWWWWKATRMGSGFDIQEFPFFSFQFGDLHPHVLVMPFLVTALAVGFAIVLSARARVGPDVDDDSYGGAADFLAGSRLTARALLLGVLVGGMALGATLAQDVPVQFAVLATLAAVGLQTAAGALAEGRAPADDPERLDGFWWLRNPGLYVVLALFLGGIIFIDSWTMPLVLSMLLAVALIANWLQSGGWSLRLAVDSIGFALPVLAATFFFYLPFHLNSELAANGLRITQTATTVTFPPSQSEATRPLHFLLFWGPLLWVSLSFLAVHVYARRREIVRPGWVGVAALAWAAPAIVWLAWIVGGDGFAGVADELSERGQNLGTLAIIVALLMIVVLALIHQIRLPAGRQDRGLLFALQLATFAFLMLLGAELFFVDDSFHWRANTVFRFWHESWIILAVVGGFGLYRLTRNWRMPEVRLGESFWPNLALAGAGFGAVYSVIVATEPWDVLYAKWWTATLGLLVGGATIVAYAVASAVRGSGGALALQRVGWIGVTAAIIAGALVYPVAVTFERTEGFRRDQSMDGLVGLQRGNPSEYDAVRWLRDNVEGTPVLVEAVGSDYTDYARISSATGLSTVLGWPGHELQWRGSAEPFAGREEDVRRVYETSDPVEARDLLEKYDVRYVYVGHLERQTYDQAGLAKFDAFMMTVFQDENVTVYQLPEEAAVVAEGDAAGG